MISGLSLTVGFALTSLFPDAHEKKAVEMQDKKNAAINKARPGFVVFLIYFLSCLIRDSLKFTKHVIIGLDPIIYLMFMDCRVKPGNDIGAKLSLSG